MREEKRIPRILLAGRAIHWVSCDSELDLTASIAKHLLECVKCQERLKLLLKIGALIIQVGAEIRHLAFADCHDPWIHPVAGMPEFAAQLKVLKHRILFALLQ